MSVPKRQLILGTAGHIDHGKTTLVAKLTGVDTDRLPEEQRRGMTIDIGFAKLMLGDYELGIVDVPGHERFVRNMLAGATGNDLAMLVVAADDSVMPQTREHLEILKLLDLQFGVVVITKCDLVEEDLLELVEQEVHELVVGTFLDGAAIVRTSATDGTGIDELRSQIFKVCNQIEAGSISGISRMAVDRCFVVKGQGTVVTGSVASGLIRIGDEMELFPTGQKLRVRSLQSHDQVVEYVQQGQRAAIGLGGVHHRQVERGNELATIGYLKPTRLITATLTVSRSSPWPVKHRSQVRLHIGTGQVVATITLFSVNKLMPGETATVQLHLADPITVTCGQPFVIRQISPVSTLGGGLVLQSTPARIARNSLAQIQQAELFGLQKSRDRAVAAIRSYGMSAWTDLDLCRDAKIDIDQVAAILSQLRSMGIMVDIPIGPQRIDRLHQKTITELSERIVESVKRYLVDHALQACVPRAVLAKQILSHCDDALFVVLLQELADDGQVLLDGDTVALPDYVPQMDKIEQLLYQSVLKAYQAGGFQPPAPAELAQKHETPLPLVRQMIDLAVTQNKLKHLGGSLYLCAEVEKILRARVSKAIIQSGGMTISQIRQLLETSRKFAVPLCEYLDRQGITCRQGDIRVLGVGARKLERVVR